MRKLVPDLFELQELEITLQESHIVHGTLQPEKVTAIETKIAKLRKKIPASHLKRYDQFRKGGLAVVQEIAGVCTSCHLRIPIGDLGRMRRGEMVWACPNCGRFLLVTDTTGQQATT